MRADDADTNKRRSFLTHSSTRITLSKRLKSHKTLRVRATTSENDQSSCRCSNRVIESCWDQHAAPNNDMLDFQLQNVSATYSTTVKWVVVVDSHHSRHRLSTPTN